ncbi:alpha/beta fold hydrolase [Patescibacteria group bacterium AH-259-L07]|nr:alpha/beta fold hydrolase [Patescibacteria group bacterium AH-259-L07]
MDKLMIILFAIILFFLFASLFGFYISIRPPKFISDINPKDLGFDYEEVSFVTKDGLTLRGWFIPAKTQKVKTIILLHGYPADKGNILPLLTFLNQKYNLLLFDFRYLGQSDGKYSTIGAKETEDLFAAIRYLRSRGIEEVGVWGFSLGGAVALMTAAQSPEIKAVVSESSYANLDLMARQLYNIPVLKYPLAYLISLWAKIFLGIDIKNISPEKSVQNITIPILIIHSSNDEVIPFSNALRLKQALKNNLRAEFWFQENLVHGELGDKYQKRIEDFFKKHL